MGIPRFFGQIIEKFPKTHFWKANQHIDHFFIDFNSIVYDTHASIDKEKTNQMSTSQYESFLIKQVVAALTKMIVEVAKPKKTCYIAMDGPAPRAKMIQQRWRRFKGYHDEIYFTELKKKHGIEIPKHNWKTVNVSPGTKFMEKLSFEIVKAIKESKFNKHQKSLKIIFSDSNIPGEGEHKFMPMVRSLVNKKDETVCMYSPDADVIVLAMSTHKSNILILRRPRIDSEIETKQYISQGVEYFYLDIDVYRAAFIEANIGVDIGKDEVRIITDYVFLTFLGGNDFVIPIPYLQIKKERALDILINLYRKYLPLYSEYLIYFVKGQPMINMQFFKSIIDEIVRSEDYYMRGIQIRINKVKNEGLGDERRLSNEEGKTLYEKERAQYEHYPYYSKLHPEYKKYEPIFSKLNFSLPKHEWKHQYYQHFFNISMEDQEEYNSYRSKVCLNYLEAFVFTLRYYFNSTPPSWNWFYHFRAPPTISDLKINLDKFIPDLNKIQFECGKPYQPFDQLMMILPPQLGDYLPKGYGKLMDDELLPYYPIGFELDVIIGEKHIYAEPILPIIDDKKVINETKKIKLSTLDKKRNQLGTKPFEFQKK